MHGDVGNHLGTSPETPHDEAAGLTVQQAATQWGVSVNTVRRWIKAGRVHAEQVPTPAGFVYRVSPGQVPTMGTHQEVPSLAPDVARAEAMASYSRALLEPVMAELAETRRQLTDQAETIGQLRQEVEQLQQRLALEAPREAETPVERIPQGREVSPYPDVEPTPWPWWDPRGWFR